MENEVVRLKGACKEQSIVLEMADGEEKKYVLRELFGKDRNSYFNKMKGRVTVDKDKNIQINDFNGFHAELLKISLFYESGEPVPVDEIEILPSTTQQKLFEMAQELSGLNTEQDSEKNG
jgi:hypothetical protein